MPDYYNYILRCADGTLYSGSTVDPQKRLAAHNAGRGGAYTRPRRPVRMIALWRWPDKSAAMSAECRVKRLTREEKLALIAGKISLPEGKRLPSARLPKAERARKNRASAAAENISKG